MRRWNANAPGSRSGIPAGRGRAGVIGASVRAGALLPSLGAKRPADRGGLTDVVDAEIDVASTLVCAADGCVDSAPAVEAEGACVPAPLEDVGCAAAGAALGSAEGAAVGAGAVVGGGSSGDRDGRSVSGST